ncbi:MAG: bifunctional oligoribonuclease/PAP phosphatase NrnA [Ruminococcaceae bacterium]|nr:bifunctional oligoribonuclease/PAP phosphatase NrnA [Oscillospiraceae bacterium]
MLKSPLTIQRRHKLMVNLLSVAQILKEKDNIEILTHHYPDGDTLGSAYALCLMLQTMGKNARVITSGTPAQKYDFLKNGVIEQEFEREFVVSVDVAAPSLLGENQAEYEGIIDLCIDHHRINSIVAKEKFVDADSASASEIIFRLSKAMEIALTADMAACIYTGVSTDTGCFRYSNTTPETLRIAAELMEITPDWHRINTVMFEMKSKEKLRLERMVYRTLEYFCDGKGALIYTTLEMQEEAGVPDGELEGLASIPRQIEGVLLGITMKEKEKGIYKVSVRTNENVNAAEFCALFGGGGHNAAAGCTVEGTLEEAKEKLIKAAQEVL